jgi:predicted HTH transcriptional regulator
MVAHLYGLTEEEFAHILSTFPLVPQATRDAALEEYRKQASEAQKVAADPLAAQIKAMIHAGESATVEFKRTLEFVADADLLAKNIPLEQKPQKMRLVLHSAFKSVCAFLNSRDGGTLLLGVHDDGYPVGIDPDLQSVKNKNSDGFELKLRSFLDSRFQPRPLHQVKIQFANVDGYTVCRVDVSSDPEIFHLDNEVFVRDGNRTVQLQGADLTNWIRRRSTPSL